MSTVKTPTNGYPPRALTRLEVWYPFVVPISERLSPTRSVYPHYLALQSQIV